MSTNEPVVLVTGSGGTLGRATAQLFAEQNARLALLDRNPEHLQRVYGSGETGTRLLLSADLLDREAVATAVDRTIAHFGQIDALINIAGGFHMGEAVHETDASTWEGMFNLNVRTMTNTVQAVVPHMLAAGRGKIVNIGAYAARHGGARKGAYIASKSAVIRITESMALELREHGINVNCVLPTIIDTPANRADMPDADPARWVAPEALADVIAFLASDAARAVHGAALPVTGLS